MAQVKIFDDKFVELIDDDVQFLQLDCAVAKDTSPNKEEWVASNTAKLLCSYCRVEFLDSAQHREHYKLDWHRYNLKQSLLGRPSLPEEVFNDKTGDLSSISGSESDKDDSLDVIAVSQGRIFLRDEKGTVLSMYRCLVGDKKENLDNTILLQRLRLLCKNLQWTVLMLGGGHFAGAVFKGATPILHKTFHCYTVRAGQGGSQSARDNRSGGSQPKSTGASLRRYNESALIQHVRDIVEEWRSEIGKSVLIVYRAVGPTNRAVFFGGKVPLLDRADPRLRTVPFSTRRATFTELKRVHDILTTVQVYESLETAVQQLPKKSLEQETKRTKTKLPHHLINRAKSREIVERPLPITSPSSSSSENELRDSKSLGNTNSKDDKNNVKLFSCNEEISFQDALQPFEDTLTPEQRKKTKIKKPKKSKNQKLREQEEQRKRQIYELGSTGKIDNLRELIQVEPKKLEQNLNTDENAKLKHQPYEELLKPCLDLNEVLDEKGNTLLHIAAIHEQPETVTFLLENNADPCIKNKNQHTPYTSTQNKDIREVFKYFAQRNPEKYNYNKAHIPLNMLSAEELAEKKKAQRKVKRVKEQVKKKENHMKKEEQLEKDRFLNLSDREKRALAAERRILNQSGAVVSRCFLCASDMAGKVPFEYSGNRFCSVDCLKAHRMKNPVVLSV